MKDILKRAIWDHGVGKMMKFYDYIFYMIYSIGKFYDLFYGAKYRYKYSMIFAIWVLIILEAFFIINITKEIELNLILNNILLKRFNYNIYYIAIILLFFNVIYLFRNKNYISIISRYEEKYINESFIEKVIINLLMIIIIIIYFYFMVKWKFYISERFNMIIK